MAVPLFVGVPPVLLPPLLPLQPASLWDAAAGLPGMTVARAAGEVEVRGGEHTAPPWSTGMSSYGFLILDMSSCSLATPCRVRITLVEGDSGPALSGAGAAGDSVLVLALPAAVGAAACSVAVGPAAARAVRGVGEEEREEEEGVEGAGAAAARCVDESAGVEGRCCEGADDADRAVVLALAPAPDATLAPAAAGFPPPLPLPATAAAAGAASALAAACARRALRDAGTPPAAAPAVGGGAVAGGLGNF